MMLINTNMKIEMTFILLSPSFFLSSVDQWWLIQWDGNNSCVSQLIGYLQSKLANLTINNYILLLFWDERSENKIDCVAVSLVDVKCFYLFKNCETLLQLPWNVLRLYHINLLVNVTSELILFTFFVHIPGVFFLTQKCKNISHYWAEKGNVRKNYLRRHKMPINTILYTIILYIVLNTIYALLFKNLELDF